MRELSRLWRTLEAAPVLAGVEAQWKEWLGDELEAARAFLRPEQKLADTYPCPNGGGENCPRRVVVHAADDLAAVCGNAPAECETVRLKRQDLLVHRFDVAALATEIARLLDLEEASGETVNDLGAHALGTIAVSSAHRFPAFLIAQARTEDGRHAIERLLARHGPTPLLLVTPTAGVPAPTRATLDGRSCGLLACSDAFAWADTGLVAKEPAKNLLAAFRARFTYDVTPLPPLSVHEPIAPYGLRALAFTHDDASGRALTDSEYEQFLAARDDYDTFVDGSGATRVVRRRGAKGKLEEDTLTAPEFEMLVRYVRRRARNDGPCVPAKLGVTQQSPDAARKMFIRMRQKVDMKVTGQQYRLFKQRRRFEGGGSEYAFEPDADVRFCVLAPPA